MTGDYTAVSEARRQFPPEDGEHDMIATSKRTAFILGAGWQAGKLLQVVQDQITRSERGIVQAQQRITEGLGVDRDAVIALAEHNAEAVAYRYIYALMAQELRPE